MSSPAAPAPAATPAPAAAGAVEPYPASAFLNAHVAPVGASLPAPLASFLKAVLANIATIEQRVSAIPALQALRQNTGLPPFAVAAAVACALVAVVLRTVRLNAPLVSDLIGAVYPAARSLTAVERPSKDDDERLLTYWAVFGAFSVTDHLSERILRAYPLYYSTKVAILLWLFNWDGSLKLYRNVARPLLIKYGGLNSSSATPERS